MLFSSIGDIPNAWSESLLEGRRFEKDRLCKRDAITGRRWLVLEKSLKGNRERFSGIQRHSIILPAFPYWGL
jgi:hypothetical protein